MDDAHEEIANFRARHCFEKQGVVAMPDRSSQDSLTDVVIERGPGFVKKERQLTPAFQDVLEG